MLEKSAATSLNSKLVSPGHKEFFAKMVVDAVLRSTRTQAHTHMIGMKKVQGGALQDLEDVVEGVLLQEVLLVRRLRAPRRHACSPDARLEGLAPRMQPHTVRDAA